VINRSISRQSLTELGRDYLDHCRHLLEEAEAGDALAEEALTAPRGRLRIATSVAFGSYSLTPAVVRFMQPDEISGAQSHTYELTPPIVRGWFGGEDYIRHLVLPDFLFHAR